MPAHQHRRARAISLLKNELRQIRVLRQIACVLLYIGRSGQELRVRLFSSLRAKTEFA
jgi:hypothetical protein